MKTFVCQACRHITFDEAPVECPVCSASIENFENYSDQMHIPADSSTLTEEEKKHIPVITIGTNCGSAHAEVCTNLSISVGEIPHVMETEHYITFIDIYKDKKFLVRTTFTPRKTFPAAALHLNLNGGRLAVIADCNIHGSWLAKMKLPEETVSG